MSLSAGCLSDDSEPSLFRPVRAARRAAPLTEGARGMSREFSCVTCVELLLPGALSAERRSADTGRTVRGGSNDVINAEMTSRESSEGVYLSP